MKFEKKAVIRVKSKMNDLLYIHTHTGTYKHTEPSTHTHRQTQTHIHRAWKYALLESILIGTILEKITFTTIEHFSCLEVSMMEVVQSCNHIVCCDLLIRS